MHRERARLFLSNLAQLNHSVGVISPPQLADASSGTERGLLAGHVAEFQLPTHLPADSLAQRDSQGLPCLRHLVWTGLLWTEP